MLLAGANGRGAAIDAEPTVADVEQAGLGAGDGGLGDQIAVAGIGAPAEQVDARGHGGGAGDRVREADPVMEPELGARGDGDRLEADRERHEGAERSSRGAIRVSRIHGYAPLTLLLRTTARDRTPETDRGSKRRARF